MDVLPYLILWGVFLAVGFFFGFMLAWIISAANSGKRL